MPNRNDSWGIEVGANAVKAVRLIRRKGEILVADYEIIPFKKILTTPDINVDEAIQVALDQFLSQHIASKSTVMISVPGHMAFARFAKLPPVDPKKIPDIVRFEAVQQIPFPIEQVEWDYQVFSRADSPDVEVGIVAITKERVAQYLNNYFSVGLSVDGLTLSPMAVYNALAYDMEITPESPGVIFMDIGTIATDVIIVENGQVWLRTLPIGGNNFTDALVRAFKLSFPKAERLKREAGTSKYARQIFQAMRPVFADLVQEMQRSLGYYQSLYRDAKLTRLVGVGSTFRLPGMQKFLKQQLQMEVIRPDGFKRIKVEGKQEAAFAENAMNLATAYGLALQGLELEMVSVNILPKPIIRQRLWRDKSKWFAIAAGLSVAAVSMAGAKFWYDTNRYNDARAETDKVFDPTLRDARQYIDEWKRVVSEQDPRMQIENLRGVLDYREVWPKILMDIDLVSRALNPQDELSDWTPSSTPGGLPQLKGVDYVKFMKVPRGERRRFYIESLTQEYHFDKMPEAKIDAPAPGATPPAAAAAAAPANAASAIAAKSGAPARKPWGNDNSPYFIITITGTASNDTTPVMISETYIKWLQANAERLDRPYRIVAGSDSLVMVDHMIDDSSIPGGPSTPAAISSVDATGAIGATGDAGAQSPSGTPGPAQGPGGRGIPPGAPGGPGGPNAPPGGDSAVPGPPGSPPPRRNPWSTARPAAAPNAGTDMYPLSPLAAENTAHDYHFIIKWKVQLLRPEDVRHAEAFTGGDTASVAAPAQPAAPGGGSAPTPAVLRKPEAKP